MIQEKVKHDRGTEPWVQDLLVSLMRAIGAKDVLEIGVFQGVTTRRLLEALPQDGHYVAVDPEAYLSFSDPRLELYKQSSHEVLGTFASDVFDFIFVDGDHTFTGAQQDINQSLRLLRQGGVMAVHDTMSLMEPSVGIAMRLLLPDAVTIATRPFNDFCQTGLTIYSRPTYICKMDVISTPTTPKSWADMKEELSNG